MPRTLLCWLTTALALLAAASPGRAGVALFGRNTDTIQVSGQTVFGTAATYEAVLLFPSALYGSGRVFNEWQGFAEDKYFAVVAGPSGGVQGFNYALQGGLLAGPGAVSFDEWHHVAFVYDGAEERVYLDGSLLGSRATSGDVSDSEGSIAHVGAIFRDGGMQPSFVGLIDVLRLSDVARYAGASFTPPSPDLLSDGNTVLLYAFDDASGSESVVDASGFARTGTVAAGFGGATAPSFCGADSTDTDGDFIPDTCDPTPPSTVTTSSTTTSTNASSTTTTSTTSSSATSSSSTTTSTVTPASTTTTTLAGATVFPPGKKLQVKQKKSGAQRLQLLARDAGIAAALPCEVGGELVIEAAGAAAPLRRLALDAALWKPIKAAKPERGCKYRKGPVVATVLLKTGKSLTIVANADDLGIPLATDPRPVRVELRHGDVRHCLEFGGTGKHKPGKKLLARNAPGAAACPGGSASGAFVD